MKKLHKFSFAFLLIAMFLPSMASAADPACTGTGLGLMLCNIHSLLNSVLPVLVALGVVYLVWGIVQYFIKDSDEAKKKGRDTIIYGIIGLAVIMSLWGLVNIVVTTFGLGGQAAPVPELISSSSVSATNCTLAGANGVGVNLQNLLNFGTCFIQNSVIPFLFAVAIAFFVWGAVKFFLINGDEEKKRDEGKQFMLWAIIALAVMIGVWGLVKILAATFGISTSVLPQVKP